MLLWQYFLDEWVITGNASQPFVAIQSFSRIHVQLFVTPWPAARQASLSFTISQSLLKLVSFESMMPSNYLIPCRPFASFPQSFPASGSFPMSGQSIGASASASVFPTLASVKRGASISGGLVKATSLLADAMKSLPFRDTVGHSCASWLYRSSPPQAGFPGGSVGKESACNAGDPG